LKKADLVERQFQFQIKKSKTEEAFSSATQNQASTSSSTTGGSDLAKVLQLFHQQQGLQEQRFLKQMEEFHHLLKQNTDQRALSYAHCVSLNIYQILENFQNKREEVASLYEVEVLISLVEKSH